MGRGQGQGAAGRRHQPGPARGRVEPLASRHAVRGPALPDPRRGKQRAFPRPPGLGAVEGGPRRVSRAGAPARHRNQRHRALHRVPHAGAPPVPRSTTPRLPPRSRSWARRALVAEGVALHFLEDSFSAGHYAAEYWGGAAWAKGTHDYYSTVGLTTMTWKGNLFASHGDANMTEQDMRVAAVTVRQSLAQVASAAEGRMPLPDRRPLPGREGGRGAQLLQGRAPPAPGRPGDGPRRGGHGPPEHPRSRPAARTRSILPRARADMGLFVGAISGYRPGRWPSVATTAGPTAASGREFRRSAPGSASGWKDSSRGAWTGRSGCRASWSGIRPSSTSGARPARPTRRPPRASGPTRRSRAWAPEPR